MAMVNISIFKAMEFQKAVEERFGVHIHISDNCSGLYFSFDEPASDEIIEFAELEKFVDVPLKNYSSGMKARLGFSVATMVDPEILIVDEILAVGDERFQAKSLKRMNQMMQGGTTVLMVSHHLEQIRSLCSRAIWLNKGTLVMDGGTEEVCNAYHRSLMG